MAARKIRVGVSGHDLKFWYPLQRSLEATGRYEFREDVWTGHNTHDPDCARALLEWADVLVAEWALANAVYYARHKRPHQRLIVRLHLQERGTPYPAEIDYANVERVVFVGPHILEECVEKFSMPRGICTVLGNFIDSERYNLPKFGGAEYTLGIIGTAPSRKRLDLALDTLELLARHDDRYALRVKGASPASIPWLWMRTAERDYYQRVYARINSGEFRHRVIFDPQGNDVQHWLQMVGHILSPSDFESFHMAVSEGAASGALPVVWNWDGAADIYPEFPLVEDAVAAAEAIEFHNRSAAGGRYRDQVKQVIAARYDSSVIVKAWDDLISGRSDSGAPLANKRAERRDVLVVWAIDNWTTFHRREMIEALARQLSGAVDVLVVEPGSHYESIVKLGWASEAEMADIAAQRLPTAAPGIFRTRLLTGRVPAPSTDAGSTVFPDDPLATLDQVLDRHFGADARVLHWVYKPDQALKLGDRAFVYEVYDDYTYDFGTGTPIPQMADAEERMLPKAACAFFTSQPLMDRKAGQAAKAVLVGNGVNFEPFSRYRPQNPDVPGRKVAGYLGNLSDFFDWALMSEVCARMPELDFVFHGQIEREKLGERASLYQAMREMPNVVFTGRVSRGVGAAAVARYDVLLIPFVVNDAMHAVNPLKLWEYFATGQAVVSTPMDAIQDLAPLVAIADGADAWVEAIRQALDQHGAERADAAGARIARAEEHRWDYLTRQHAQAVSEAFAGLRRAS
jgi:glycosyltransferase involved in cell wall biosynthesis